MRTHELIRESNGRLFTVDFIKKNGELRHMRARLHAPKDFKFKGTGLRYDPIERGLLPVWDTQKRAFRMINLRTVRKLRVNGTTYEFHVRHENLPVVASPRQHSNRSHITNNIRSLEISDSNRTYTSQDIQARASRFSNRTDTERDPNDCSHKHRLGSFTLPEGEGWRVDVFADKTCKVGCTAFGEESTRKAYDLLCLIFKS